MRVDDTRISTIVLNWNRAELLRATLRSYAETAREPFDLTVVDNASGDHSRSVIEESKRLVPSLRAVYCDRNFGGEALNDQIARAAGSLIHLHENDILLLAGWQDHAIETFRAFGDLGQLSLFNGIPTDEFPADPQPVTLRFSAGKILYEAHGNVGTSSILRAELFGVHGVRVHNLRRGDADAFSFPDDGRLSRDVRASGYWCAYSDRRYIRNVGHELDEFDRDPEYYAKNYASKPWIGAGAWRERVAAARGLPRPNRSSGVLPGAAVQPERTAGLCGGVEARLWSMLDTRTPEVEVLDLLHALVRLTKPRRALETSTWLGSSAIAIGSALRDNGFGRLRTLERDPGAQPYAVRNVAAANLAQIVTIRSADDPGDAPDEGYDFVFLNAGASDFVQQLDSIADGATLVFHGRSIDEATPAGALDLLMSAGLVHGVAPRTPRGLFIGTLTKPADGMLPRLPADFDPRGYLAANPDVERAGADPAEHYRRSGWREGRRTRVTPMPDDRDSYRNWRTSYKKPGDWDASYGRGQWDYLNEIGEVPHYALAAGYVHKLLRGGDVLDAGCGEAVLCDYLDLSRFRYTGIDVSETAIARAEQRVPRGTVLVSSIESYAPPAGVKFAAVVFNESVQHTDTPLESIDRYREFLTGDGIVVVSLYKTPDDEGNGPRLARFLAAECDAGRYTLVDRAEAVSVSHRRAWELFVLR
jgi:2-polyprenyl-3-methyl-5-hydroxy-6-metoxy-1,4-benzoquinol methylase